MQLVSITGLRAGAICCMQEAPMEDTSSSKPYPNAGDITTTTDTADQATHVCVCHTLESNQSTASLRLGKQYRLTLYRGRVHWLYCLTPEVPHS